MHVNMENIVIGKNKKGIWFEKVADAVLLYINNIMQVLEKQPCGMCTYMLREKYSVYIIPTAIRCLSVQYDAALAVTIIHWSRTVMFNYCLKCQTFAIKRLI